MNPYQPKNILVTGGAGFIGTNFIRYKLENAKYDVQIINYDLLTYAANFENLKDLPTKLYKFVHGDIRDFTHITKVLEEYKIDTVIHFAAESHVDRSIVTPDIFIDTNVKGTYTLLEATRQYWAKEFNLSPQACRFYHVSTDEVFGSLSIDDRPRVETDPYLPSSPYSASKAAADHLVRAYHYTYGLPTVLSYCTNNYGPYQHIEKLIPMIINCCLGNQKIPIYGQGKNIRDWIYVKDHCRAIDVLLIHASIGETYNISSENELSNNDIVMAICELMNEYMPQPSRYSSLIHYVTDRPGHDFRYALNNKKLRNNFNWQPNMAFMSGLKDTIEFYLRQSNEKI